MPWVSTAGANLQYIKAGRGPAVLLLQGIGVIGEAWRPQIDALADRFTVVAPDNRGIGGSRVTNGPITIEAMARDAIAIMDVERIDRFHLVGHSMGGAIAQAVALEARPRILTLSLCATFSRGRDAVTWSPGLLWLAVRTRIGTTRMCRDAYLELILSRTFLAATGRDEAAALIARLFGHEINHQPPIVIRQLRALARYDARDRFTALAGVPTLVISASDDRIARPIHGRALAAAIPGARYVEIADAGHAVPIERANEVTNLLAAHFERAGLD